MPHTHTNTAPHTEQKKPRILIVGLGLLGGSYAAALTRQGYEVGALDIDADAIRYARDGHLIAHGETEPSEAYVRQFDLAVFALYPHTVVDWIRQYQAFFRPGALLTDVTGVKGRVVYPIQEMLRPDLEFIGAHPMAGREVFGVRNASADLFRGANYIVTPTPRNSEDAIRRCEELGRRIGCARISRLSPEQHDEMIGFLSQLTHCIAVALMSCKDSTHLADYTGDSFRDLTRIAKINEVMWSELFLANRDELLAQMDLFLNKFRVLRDALRDGDRDTLMEAMRLSTARRKYFDKPE